MDKTHNNFLFLSSLIILGFFGCEKPDVPPMPKIENECIFNQWEQLKWCRPSDSFYIKCLLNGNEWKIDRFRSKLLKQKNQQDFQISMYKLGDTCAYLLQIFSFYHLFFAGTKDTLFMREGTFMISESPIQALKNINDERGNSILLNEYVVNLGNKNSLSNYIVFDKFNQDTTILEGSFQFDLKSFSGPLDSIVITNGKFRLKTCWD